MTYKDTGVDIAAGNKLIDSIKPIVSSTVRSGAHGALGGFGAIFDLKATGYKDPLIVAATDGVGTKLRIASETSCHHTIGIDLVAMCVNDLIVQGAEPLFFLDYYASGKLFEKRAKEVISGIAQGCRIAGCALIGGETAEMPGIYDHDDYDLAGFAVGAVERHNLLDGTSARNGDVLLGLRSSGIHSNGFSMIRKIIERIGINYDTPSPFSSNETLGEALLTPTKIYVKACLSALKLDGITGLSHITGGGLIENPPRAFSANLTARIDVATWDLPTVFSWIAEMGGITPIEMARTFNCGIGMLVSVAPDRVAAVVKIFESMGEIVHQIGVIENKSVNGPSVILENLENWAME